MSKKLIVVFVILVLALMNRLGRDVLSSQIDGFLTNELRILHYILMPIIAYYIANYFTKTKNKSDTTNKDSLNKKFLFIFLIVNAYSFSYFAYNAISNRIINKEIRESLNDKLVELEYSGFGYECDSMNYKEYNELNDGYYPSVPESSSNIFLYNWYEIDASHELEFSVSRKFDISKFYKNDSTILSEIREIKYGEFLQRHRVIDKRVMQESRIQKFDTIRKRRYKWKRTFG